MPILRIILLVLVVGIVGSGIYLFSQPESPTSQAIMAKLPAGSDQTIKNLQTTVNDVKDNRLAPLGKTVQQSQILSVDEDRAKPIHEKAFDFARYQYCIQVVKDFERKKEQSTQDSSENSEE